MKLSRYNLVCLFLVVASFGLAAGLYTRLPDPVPTHWSPRGVADGFTPKPWGAFLLPLVIAGVFALFRILPKISPRGFRMDRFRRVFEILQTAILSFLFLATVVALLAAAGIPFEIHRAIFAGLGLLFLVIGNFMGKLTKNFFVGIRTPWTLASEEVWLRTHRLGGKLFVLAGLVIFLAGLLGAGVEWLLGVTLFVAAICVLYSYLLYRRLEGFKNGEAGDPLNR